MAQRKQSEANIPRQQAVLAGIFLVVLVSAAISLGTNLFQDNIARAWSFATSHQPERYTELYFNDPAHLPSYAPAGKIQSVVFVIVNHEAEARTYTYRMSIRIGKVTTTRTATVTLRDGQSATGTIQFKIPLPNEQVYGTVDLLGTGQHLAFRSQS